MSHKDSAESVVRQIRRKTRRKYSAEEKIRIVFWFFYQAGVHKTEIEGNNDPNDEIQGCRRVQL